MKREEGLLLEKRSLAELKQRLESEQSSVKHEHEEVKSKLIELDHTGEQIKKEKERLAQIYFDLHALDGKSTGRLQQLQRSVTNLRQQEEQMSEVNQQIKFVLRNRRIPDIRSDQQRCQSLEFSQATFSSKKFDSRCVGARIVALIQSSWKGTDMLYLSHTSCPVSTFSSWCLDAFFIGPFFPKQMG